MSKKSDVENILMLLKYMDAFEREAGIKTNTVFRTAAFDAFERMLLNSQKYTGK
ncbi:MAG: hypothetical protein UIH99_04105 [Alphaproteobacteria bacterium]|jgi:hypothetical protein|nr:hypothetical protein [Alphaproteobacteria bacterium]